MTAAQPQQARFRAELHPAMQARERRDWPGLAEQAASLRAHFPAQPQGYTLGVIALRHLGRVAETDQLLAAGLALFPANPVLLAHARLPAPPTASSLQTRIAAALNARDWAETLRLAQLLRSRYPDDELGYCAAAQAHREQKQPWRAETVMTAARSRLAPTLGILTESALTARAHRDYGASADYLGALRALRPELAWPYARGGRALIEAGRFEEAEAVLTDAILRFPNDPAAFIEHAELAMRQEQLELARERWDIVRRMAPDHDRLKNAAGRVDLAHQLKSIADAETPPPAAPRPEPARLSPDLPDADLLLQFEALGGNCEFGLVQRLAGIEPLGLLRFAAIAPNQLSDMLDQDLGGVGDDEHSSIELSSSQEYMLSDRRYFLTHTFIKFGTTDEATLRQRLARRTRFLRDKLLADLAAPHKICVFLLIKGDLIEAELARLHAALRRHGPNRLLFVQQLPNATPAIVVRSPSLFLATIPSPAPAGPPVLVAEQRYPAWLTLLRQIATP